MNKYYRNRKNKDTFYFGNNKNVNNTNNLFRSQTHNDDYNKFINDY